MQDKQIMDKIITKESKRWKNIHKDIKDIALKFNISDDLWLPAKEKITMISGPRQSHKTIKLLESAHKTKATVVCVNSNERSRLIRYAKELKLNIEHIIIFAAFISGCYGHSQHKTNEFHIDNADMLFNDMFGFNNMDLLVKHFDLAAELIQNYNKVKITLMTYSVDTNDQCELGE